jgi:hypothetical protein
MKFRLAAALALLVLPVSAPAGASGASAEARLAASMAEINVALAARGANYRLSVVETLTATDEQGLTVYALDRGNKQLGHDFIPGLAYVGGSSITYGVDTTDNTVGSLTLADVEGAFDRAMATWENAVCSVIPIVEIEDPAGDLGVVEYILSGGTAGADDAYADLTFAGFGTIVDAILGPTTLAATFTFNYIDDDGNDTDLDGNGLLDTAFREIYFVGSWDWNIDDHYDVETVALHEAGHGLSQAHFGMITETEANGKIHFSPRAVMNAAYSGIQQRLGKSDLAGHCTLWADWPNN